MRSSASRLYLTDDRSNPAAIPTHFLEESRRNRPVPLESNALLAAARRLTGERMNGRPGGALAQSWQEDAWDMVDLVGEQRFLVTTLASRVAQVQFYVGKLNPQAPRDQPEPVTDSQIAAILDPFGGTHTGRTQIVKRLAVNLLVSGDGWLAGVPRRLIPGTVEYEQEREAEMVFGPSNLGAPNDDIAQLEWLMFSISEITRTRDNLIELRLAAGPEGVIVVDPDEVYLIRVWNPHPRRAWEADSPTRASLPVLRELVGLTMDVSAQVDSRLAGAGLLIVPQSAQRALAAAANAGSFDESTEDLFTEALMEAMLTPISDRASASALVPLVVTVPDEAAEKFRHIRFGRDLEASGIEMRAESIRRLALGQDAPPELLLGTAGMNHWGAWLVREDVVTTHIEPPAALICDALTTQYLWPVLAESFGMALEEYRDYVIWYDVSDMITRPNRTADAKDLHTRGVINDEALRRESGFEESDAPLGGTTDQPIEVVLALNMVRAAPALMANPGLSALVEQIRATLAGEVVEPLAPIDEGASEGVAENEQPPPVAPDAPPQTSDNPAPVP